eukprot:13195395-Alexandrium_andersonii.AAC.1
MGWNVACTGDIQVSFWRTRLRVEFGSALGQITRSPWTWVALGLICSHTRALGISNSRALR